MIETKINPKSFVKEYLMRQGLRVKKLKIITDEKPYLIIVELTNKLAIDKAVDLSIDLMKKIKEDLEEEYQVNIIPE